MQELNKKNIEELEAKVDYFNVAVIKSQNEMYSILEYIRHNKRWKENKRYAKSSFFKYVKDRFNITEPQYRKCVTAFIKHPEEAEEYGPGVVIKAINKCGPIKSAKVFEEFAETKNLNRDKMDDIIDKNAKPKTDQEVKPNQISWKKEYEKELRAHQKTQKDLLAAHKRITELEEMNRKLQAAYSALKTKNTGYNHVLDYGTQDWSFSEELVVDL